MKSIVIYYSKTGNTAKIAAAIAEGMGSELRNVEELIDLKGFSLVCIGTPVHLFAPAKEIKDFLKKLPSLKEKKVAGFCTFHRIGVKSTIDYMCKAVEKRGAQFIGEFSCKGASKIIGNFGPKICLKGRPNKNDLWEAKKFGEKLKLSVSDTDSHSC